VEREIDKIEYILSNYGRARAKAYNLKTVSNNMQFSLRAKVAVGGIGDSSKSDSDQELYLNKKEEYKEKGEILLENVKSIKESVDSLPKRQRIVVKLKYFEDLEYHLIGAKVDRDERTVKRIKKDAIAELVEGKLYMIYPQFKEILED